MSENIVELKQAKSLFNDLIRNKDSVFYGADEITKTLIGYIKKSD